MKKFYIYYLGKENGQRVSRLAEEANKRGFQVIRLNLREILLTDAGIFSGGERVKVKKNDISWVCGNSLLAHEVIGYYENNGLWIWPNLTSISFGNKFYAAEFFTSIGLKTPKTILLSLSNTERAARAVGGFPCVIKKVFGSEGEFVELIHSKEEMLEFIETCFKKAEKSKNKMARIHFVLQEFIKESEGVDYRVLCLGQEVIGIFQRKARTGFKANLSLGGTGKVVTENKKLEKYAKKIMKESGLIFAGLDFLQQNDDYLSIEINTSAQFEKFEPYTKTNIAEKIVSYLEYKKKS